MLTSKPSLAFSLLLPCTRRRLFLHKAFSRTSYTLEVDDKGARRASDKLFADAAREEAEVDSTPSKSSSRLGLDNSDVIWDGEERVQDAVLRMLMDKYKPHRTGTIRSADEKMKDVAARLVSSVNVGYTNPQGTLSSPPPPLKPKSGSWATEPLLPSTEGHQPWHTVFKTPSHATSSIKLAQLPPTSSSSSSNAKPMPSPSLVLDPKMRRMEREERKRSAHIGRLTRAREGTLDYRFGAKTGEGTRYGTRSRLVPLTEKGWQSLVEEKIEKARQAGVFESVKGRGAPIKTVTEEFNPFIAREEFLMNRIVQRNGAAPAWVEIQVELESASQNFREVIRKAWIRRAVRMVSASNPPELLRSFSLNDVKNMRDREWEDRERSYHEAALRELNSLIRKHNTLAPFVARRPYYMLKVELERMYEDCVEDILKGLIEASERGPQAIHDFGGTTSASGGTGTSPRNAGDDVDSRVGVGGDSEGVSNWLRHIVEWMGRIISRWRSR